MTQKTADEFNKTLNECVNEILDFIPDATGSTHLCIKGVIMDHFGVIIKRLVKDGERYEEASRQLDILRREVDKTDLMTREINEIQTMVGCDHIEGLSRCVRERLEGPK